MKRLLIVLVAVLMVSPSLALAREYVQSHKNVIYVLEETVYRDQKVVDQYSASGSVVEEKVVAAEKIESQPLPTVEIEEEAKVITVSETDQYRIKGRLDAGILVVDKKTRESYVVTEGAVLGDCVLKYPNFECSVSEKK